MAAWCCAVEGLMYLAPACSLWLLLGIALVEWPRMAEEGALGLMAAKPLLYLSAAAMGFGVNSLAYIVIQLASSLTLKVLARAILYSQFFWHRRVNLFDRGVQEHKALPQAFLGDLNY